MYGKASLYRRKTSPAACRCAVIVRKLEFSIPETLQSIVGIVVFCRYRSDKRCNSRCALVAMPCFQKSEMMTDDTEAAIDVTTAIRSLLLADSTVDDGIVLRMIF